MANKVHSKRIIFNREDNLCLGKFFNIFKVGFNDHFKKEGFTFLDKKLASY